MIKRERVEKGGGRECVCVSERESELEKGEGERGDGRNCMGP